MQALSLDEPPLRWLDSFVTKQTEGETMRFRIALGAVVALSAAAAGLGGATGNASAAPGNNYTCSGGNWTGDPSTSTFTSIPSGNYASITVTGVCNIVPGAVINVTGNINVAPGALFDAQSAPSTITVGHNVTAGAGSLLGLGCQPTNTIGRFAGVPCADPYGDGFTTIIINGNVTATDASDVLLRGAVASGAGKLTVNGNVTVTGGSSDVPWSIKGATIGKNLTISGVTAEFLGVQFNTIDNNATLTDITVNDVDFPPPGVIVVGNTIGRNLNCSGLLPFVAAGVIPGQTNFVGHQATGQCAAISNQ